MLHAQVSSAVKSNHELEKTWFDIRIKIWVRNTEPGFTKRIQFSLAMRIHLVNKKHKAVDPWAANLSMKLYLEGCSDDEGDVPGGKKVSKPGS